jgi:glycosyltransferase involved in cell wall biosynthesis
MKIGLVSGEFPPQEGGVGAFTQELARAFHHDGHEVHIISSRDTRPETAERTFRSRNEPVNLEFAQLHPRLERWRWPSLATIVDIVLRSEVEIVNIQYQAAAYNMNSAAINILPWRLRGIAKCVVTFHDLRIPYLFPKAGFLRRSAVNFMARHADGVIVTNQADYETLRPLLTAPPAQIPIGSNISTYSPNLIEIAEVREQLGINDDDFLLGYFGFLNESKGAEILLSALAHIDSRYHLIFIGGQTGTSDPNNAAYLLQMKQLITDLDLTDRVHWTGFLTDSRVSTYLQAVDLMVMPYRDGASLRRGTLMAALAHGRPLITTEPARPAPELKHKHNVWMVPSNDVPSLIRAIETLAGDPDLRYTIGQNARHTSSLFTWDKIAGQTIEFFKSILTLGGQS